MQVRTLMLTLQLRRSHTDLLKFAAQLARRMDAEVTGITGFQLAPRTDGRDEFDNVKAAATPAEIDLEIKEAEGEFRKLLGSHLGVPAWRVGKKCPSLAQYFAFESRSADLIISGVATGSGFDAVRCVNLGDLIIQAGRPVLLVPDACTQPRLKHALIAWTDTREARRAVCDALPMLQLATRVTLLDITRQPTSPEVPDRLADVVAWLARHEVHATTLAVQATDDEVAYEHAESLPTQVKELEGDLIVAGAYGHHHLRELALGGATRDLLLNPPCCALLSH